MSRIFKARASRAGVLMTNSRSGDGLSETVKAYLLEHWIEENLGRINELSNKFIEKGLAVEEDSITLLSEVTGEFYKKNITRYENDYLTGTPDIITDEGVVIDIKSSWSLLSFLKADLSKVYEYQLRSYMAMTGLKKAMLAYCLVDTPEALIQSEVNRIMWQIGSDAMSRDEVYQGMKKQMTYSDIRPEARVKVFHLEHDDAKLAELYARIEKAREYYNTIKLEIYEPSASIGA